jgi:hypothetical protein
MLTNFSLSSLIINYRFPVFKTGWIAEGAHLFASLKHNVIAIPSHFGLSPTPLPNGQISTSNQHTNWFFRSLKDTGCFQSSLGNNAKLMKETRK